MLKQDNPDNLANINMKDEPPRKQPRKWHPLRLLWRLFKYSCLGLIFLLLAVAGFAWWALGSSGGQAWLLKTVNAALAPNPEKPGISLALTHIQGTLPFHFQTGVKVMDANGLWLDAPAISFDLDWRKLPKILLLEKLEVADADLSRLPDLPPSPPAEPTPPFGIKDLKSVLAQVKSLLGEPHWWLPEVQIKDISLKNALLPPDLVPQKEKEKRLKINATLKGGLAAGKFQTNLDANAANADGSALDLRQFATNGVSLALALAGGANADGLDARLDTNVALDKPALAVSGLPTDFLGEKSSLNVSLNATSTAKDFSLGLTGPNLDAGGVSLTSSGSWQSGSAWAQDQLDGPVALALKLALNPPGGETILSPLKAPLNLDIDAKGDFPAVALTVDLSLPEVEYEKYKITNAKLNLASPEINIPLSESGLAALADENSIKTHLTAEYDRQPVALDGDIFFQALQDKTGTKDDVTWRAGIRDLKLAGLGISSKGEIAALLPPGQMPLLDGDLNLEINKWQALGMFVPDYKFAGQVALKVNLDSGIPNDPRKKFAAEALGLTSKNGGQKALLDLDVKNLNVKPAGGGDGYGVGTLALKADASDIFGDISLKSSLEATKIRAAGFALNARAKVDGGVKGPLEIALNTEGDVKTAIAGMWNPGKVNLKKLDVSLNPSRFLKGGKKNALVGIAMSKPAEITYGEHGLGISGLDVKITPSGRLAASGGLGADKLNLNLALEKLDFTPWQALVPQIPSGSAALNLKLTGTPTLPGGSFNCHLNKIKIPSAPLGPVSLALDGNLTHGARGSVFNVKMDIDKSTLKTLGAETALVSAAIPLVFNKSGIPALNENANIQAKVLWDGALGPIWNLVPVANQRLNGRLKINLDASGTLNKPRIRGGINVEKARYENLMLGVLLTDISLALDLTDKGAAANIAGRSLPGGMTLKASISDGYRGSVKIAGSGDLDGQNLNVKVDIDHLKPLRRRDIHVELSGALAVAGTAFSPDIKGNVVVNQGEVLLDNIAMTGSVTTLDITQPNSAKKAAAQPASKSGGMGKLDIRIRMLPRFRVDGRGLGSLWEANLLVLGSLTNPQITGTVNAVSGNFDFLGKIFELTKGTVTFAGGSISNPLLDIQLTNEQPDLTAKITVTGTVSKMRLVLSSDPTIPRDEILSRVLFGKSVSDLSRLEALQLAAAVAQLAGFGGGGGILNFTKKALGIDVLRVGTSSSGAAGDEDTGAGGTTIEAGKYITDKLYMGVQQGMKADSTAFIIQFELTPHTSLEVRSEQNNTWGGLNWKINY